MSWWSRPEAPRCSLQIEASPSLSLTLPYSIISTFSQDVYPPGNPDGRSIFVYWSPYAALKEHRFTLFHHGEHGLEKLDLEHRLPAEKKKGVSVNQQEFSTIASEACLKWNTSLPIEYYKLLKVGEKYSLMWPGDEIRWWDWGDFTVSRVLGQGYIFANVLMQRIMQTRKLMSTKQVMMCVLVSFYQPRILSSSPSR